MQYIVLSFTILILFIVIKLLINKFSKKSDDEDNNNLKNMKIFMKEGSLVFISSIIAIIALNYMNIISIDYKMPGKVQIKAFTGKAGF